MTFNKNEKIAGTLYDNHFSLTVEFGDWFELVLGWEKEIDKGDLDIHLVYFENLKKVLEHKIRSEMRGPRR